MFRQPHRFVAEILRRHRRVEMEVRIERTERDAEVHELPSSPAVTQPPSIALPHPPAALGEHVVVGGDQRINLFLYKIEENPFLKNEEWTLKPGNSNQLVPPPLSLNLFYLMTPYAKNDPQTGNATAHEILGEAMRVFYENPVIPQNHLEADLKTAREEFKIVYSALDPEELSRLWTTFAQPFRLSVRVFPVPLYSPRIALKIEPIPSASPPS